MISDLSGCGQCKRSHCPVDIECTDCGNGASGVQEFDLIKRQEVLDVLKKASFGGTITESIEAIPAMPDVNRWIPIEERLPNIRKRVLVVATRDVSKYPKDFSKYRHFVAMRIEMLSDGKWYWATAADMDNPNGIGGMMSLHGWKIIAWMPMPKYDKE